jgi:hypothetical protein
MKKILVDVALVMILICLSCCYGILILRYHLFPYYYIAKPVDEWFIPTPIPPRFTEIKPRYFKTDVEELISIRSRSDVSRLRRALIHFIWGKQNIPKRILPSKITKDYSDQRYAELFDGTLSRIDHIVVKMEFDLKSHIYHFIPQHENGNLILFHQGHDGDFFRNIRIIRKLLNAGYSVAGFSMPLQGLNNNQPTVFIPRIGYLKLTTHDHMKFLPPSKGHPVQYFLQPVVIFLNYIHRKHNYKHIGMVGISGGGWTTTLMAAVDPRIQISFPVAGTYPIYLRSKRSWGDWEQSIPELYKTANYLEMYILGAYGNQRMQLQIINLFDEACFAGIKSQTYRDIVIRRIELLGSGHWDLFLDDSHTEHIISDLAMQRIIAELDNFR